MMESAPKYRELAYRVWCENGQHIKKTVDALNKQHDFGITRQSLAKWRDEYGWEERAARAEAAHRELENACSDEAMLESLIEEHDRVKAYLNSLAPGVKPDSQLLHAYRGVAETIRGITKDIKNRRKEGLETGHEGASMPMTIKTPQDAILALQGMIEKKLSALASNPDAVSLKTTNDLLKALRMIEDEKARYKTQGEASATGDDADKAREDLIATVDELLGVKRS